MAQKSKNLLIVEVGKSQGKKYTLKSDQYTIGSDRRCDIRVEGEYVSQLHAIVTKRDDGTWIIENRSPNQTLVNHASIDSRPLSPGDQIQIGANNLFKYEVIEGKSRPVKDKKTKSSRAGMGVFQRPGIVIGLSVYLFLMIGVFVFLSMNRSDTAGSSWSQERIQSTLANSKEYLLNSNQVLGSYSNSSQVNWASDDINGYEKIVAFHSTQSGSSPSQLNEIIENLLTEVKLHVNRAWHLEKQDRWSEAAMEYKLASEILPDVNIPITNLIIRRMRWAQNQSGNS